MTCINTNYQLQYLKTGKKKIEIGKLKNGQTIKYQKTKGDLQFLRPFGKSG